MSYKLKYEALIEFIKKNINDSDFLKKLDTKSENYKLRYYQLLNDFQSIVDKSYSISKAMDFITNSNTLNTNEEELEKKKDLLFVRMNKYLFTFRDETLTEIKNCFYDDTIQIDDALALMAHRAFELFDITKNKTQKHSLRCALSTYVSYMRGEKKNSPLNNDDYIYYFMKSQLEKNESHINFYDSLENLLSTHSQNMIPINLIKKFIKEINSCYKEKMAGEGIAEDLAKFIDELNKFSLSVFELEKNLKYHDEYRVKSPFNFKMEKPINSENLEKHALELQKFAPKLKNEALALFGGEKKGSRGYKILGKALSIIGALAVVVGAVLSATGVGMAVGVPIAIAGGLLSAAGSAILFKNRHKLPRETEHSHQIIEKINEQLHTVHQKLNPLHY